MAGTVSRTEFANDFPLDSAEPERAIPHYLMAHYWWAYIHPTAVHVFERPDGPERLADA